MNSLKLFLTLGCSAVLLAACGSNTPSTTAAASTGALVPMVNGVCQVGTVQSTTPGMCQSTTPAVGMTGALVPMVNGVCQIGTVQSATPGYCQSTSPVGVGTACAVGQVSTQYGCVMQGACPVGYGMYNNSCIAATTAQYGTTPYGASPYGTVVNTGYNGMTQGPCIAGYVYNTANGMCYSMQAMGGGMMNNMGGGFGFGVAFH